MTHSSSSSSWISPLSSFGYASKGLVYAIIGILAVLAAIGSGGALTGNSGALRHLAEQPFGEILIVVVGAGLAAYAVFRTLSAFADVGGEGEDGIGLAKRVGYFGSGIAHAGLAVGAFTGVSGGGEDRWTAKLLAMPLGPWLVGLLGVAIIIAGVAQWVRMGRKSYRSKFVLDRYAARQRQWIERIARLGLGARGVVFPIVGGFLIKAAWESDPSEARGLGGALESLASQPYGPWLLGVTALGLTCYGLYCWVLAIWGNQGKSSAS